MEKDNIESKKELDIPVNVPPRDYVLNGLGWAEFGKIGIGVLFGLGIGIFIYLSNGIIYSCFIIPVITGTITFVIFRRDDHTENFIDKLGFVIEFKKSQKIYEYEYYNIYEDVNIEGEEVNGKKRNKKYHS